MTECTVVTATADDAPAPALHSGPPATSPVDAMYQGAPDDEQHLQRYLSGNCFGEYLTRSGIVVPT
jgi:hypothetical protein